MRPILVAGHLSTEAQKGSTTDRTEESVEQGTGHQERGYAMSQADRYD